MSRAESSITAIFPAHVQMPFVHGKWHRRPDGEIFGEFTREELELCMGIAGVRPEGGTSITGETIQSEQLSMGEGAGF